MVHSSEVKYILVQLIVYVCCMSHACDVCGVFEISFLAMSYRLCVVRVV